MSISVSGLGSGLDYESWIKQLVAIKQADITKVSNQVKAITKQESTLSGLKTNYNDLLTSIQKFTEAFSSDNVFRQKKATSSSAAITAKADYTSTVQSLKVSVESLATATTAKSASVAASYVEEGTKLSDISEGAIKAGSFSIYIDGEKHDISVGENDYLFNIIGRINAIDGGTGTTISADITEDGKLTITGQNGHNVVVGSSSDSSNFSNVMSLTRDKDAEGHYLNSYSSSKSIFDTNTTAAITQTPFASEPVHVTEGTFTIGNATFTIDSNTTLSSLIKQINDTAGKKDADGNSIEAGVTAYWDYNAGKLVLTATEEGASNIHIQAGTSNFTDIMELTGDGKLVPDSQTLGTNAILTINGTQITSASNTVTSDISGIKGLTLTLNDKTLDNGTPSTATVDISPDTQAAVDAITAFVNAFNTVITNTDGATKAKTDTTDAGSLYGESILNLLRNNLRKTVTANVTGDGDYTSLANIGITTGKIGTDVNKNDSSNITKLVIDTDKLTAALKNDPESVMKMLVGNISTSTEGVLTKIETTLESSLSPTKGYFVKRNSSLEQQADRLNDKIDKMNTDLTAYKKQLEAKFQAMDTIISNFQKSASIFDSYFNKSNSSNSSSSL